MLGSVSRRILYQKKSEPNLLSVKGSNRAVFFLLNFIEKKSKKIDKTPWHIYIGTITFITLWETKHKQLKKTKEKSWEVLITIEDSESN